MGDGMTDYRTPGFPNPEHRRIAAQQFERARQVISGGNHDYAIDLLQTCCKLDPGNLIYRQALRRVEKSKYKNNLRGSMLAWLTTGPARVRLRRAKLGGDHLRVLERGEAILARNPWDTGAQVAMAEAADNLGLVDLAVWILVEARQKNPKDVRVNRQLARTHEKQGNFAQAIVLWDLVFKNDPTDHEAARKRKDLAATQTIQKGRYEEMAVEGEASDFRETGGTPKPGTVDPLARQVEPLRVKIATDPAAPANYLRLAEIYRNSQQQEQALEVLKEGLNATGNNFDIQLALSQAEIEPFRENLKLTDEKLKADPQNEELRAIRVQLLKEINSREMELYRHQADRYPSDLGSRLELGIRLLRAGQNQEAIHELQQARRDPRHRWRALLFLGYSFKGKNNWLLAKRNFEEALQSLPPGEEESRKELLFQLAKGAAEERDWNAAIQHGSELANLDFDYRDIGKLLDEWQNQVHPSHPSP